MRRSRRESRYDGEDFSLEGISLDDFHVRRRAKSRRPAMTFGRLFIGLAAAAGFATFVAYPRGEAAVTPVTASTPTKWVDAAAPDELFKLDGPAVAGLALTYAVNRQAAGNGREDILTFGTPRGERAYARLEIRRAMQSGPDAGLFVALVRRAAQAGLAITRAGQSFVLPTRLGPLDASEVTLAADAHERACIGLRLRTTDTRLQLTGIACGDAGKRPAAAAAACIVDAIDLAPGSYDPPLRGFFQEAERRRGSLCQKPPAGAGLSLVDPPVTPTKPTPPAEHRHGGRHRSSTLL